MSLCRCGFPKMSGTEHLTDNFSEIPQNFLSNNCRHRCILSNEKMFGKSLFRQVLLFHQFFIPDSCPVHLFIVDYKETELTKMYAQDIFLVRYGGIYLWMNTDDAFAFIQQPKRLWDAYSVKSS